MPVKKVKCCLLQLSFYALALPAPGRLRESRVQEYKVSSNQIADVMTQAGRMLWD